MSPSSGEPDRHPDHPAECCWHPQGYGISNSAGSWWSEQCCWCKAEREMEQRFGHPPGHGPYAPRIQLKPEEITS